MHDPRLIDVVIRIGAVHRAAVVPDDEITIAPFVAVLKLRLEREFIKLIQEGIALCIAPSSDPVDTIGIDLQRLAAAQPMRADHQIVDLRRLRFFFRGPFSDTERIAAAQILVNGTEVRHLHRIAAGNASRTP